jgi:hypothetical protein
MILPFGQTFERRTQRTRYIRQTIVTALIEEVKVPIDAAAQAAAQKAFLEKLRIHN